MNLNERIALAVKKNAGVKLRAIGIPDPQKFEPHALSWSDLQSRSKSLVTLASSNLDSVTPDTPEERAAEIEDVHTGLMALHDLCEREKDHRTQIGSREARTSPMNPRAPIADDIEVRGDGSPAQSTDDEVVFALRPEQRMATWAISNGAEAPEGLTAGGFLRSMVTGPKSDVERRALAEGADATGGFTVPDVLSAALIDRLRAKSVLIRAGARTIPLTSDQNHIAKVATDPVPVWRSENEEIGESEPTFTRVTLSPKSLAVLVRVSRELLEDSLNIEDALMNALTQAMALEVDRMGLFGSGVGDEPRGLVNMPGLSTTPINAALESYGPLIKARTAILSANAPEPTAFVMHPREDGALTGLVDANGQPLQAPAKIAAIKQLTTTSVPVDGGVADNESGIIGGYFPHLLIGMRSSLRIEILKERYANQLQYGFLAHLRATVAAEHLSSFHYLTGIKPEA